MVTILAAVQATQDYAPSDVDDHNVQAAYGRALIGLLGLDRAENSQHGEELWDFAKRVIMAAKTTGFTSARLEGIDKILHDFCLNIQPKLFKPRPVVPNAPGFRVWIDEMARRIMLVKKWLDTPANGLRKGQSCTCPIPNREDEKEEERWMKIKGMRPCRRSKSLCATILLRNCPNDLENNCSFAAAEASVALDWMEAEEKTLESKSIRPVFGFCSPPNPQSSIKRSRETSDERYGACVEPQGKKTKTHGADDALNPVDDQEYHQEDQHVSDDDLSPTLLRVRQKYAHRSHKEVVDHAPTLEKDNTRLVSGVIKSSVEPPADTCAANAEAHSGALSVIESPTRAASAVVQANRSPAGLTPQVSPARPSGDSWRAHPSVEDNVESQGSSGHAPGSPVDAGPKTSINVHLLAALAGRYEGAGQKGRQEIRDEVARMSRGADEMFLQMQRGQRDHELRMQREQQQHALRMQRLAQERYVQDVAYMDAKHRQRDNTMAALLVGPISEPDEAAE